MQTTSSVPDPHAAAQSAAEADAKSREAQETQAFEAVLATSIMKPLADSMGPAGSFVTEAIATAAIERARAEGLT